MAGVVAGRELRHPARQFGGDGRVWRGYQFGDGESGSDLDDGKRRVAGSIFFALAAIADADGKFIFPRGERRDGEIHGGHLHFRQSRPAMAGAAIASGH